MSSKSNERYQVINLFDWTGGIRGKRQNPLAFPQNALMAGENVDLVDGGLKTRPGVSLYGNLVDQPDDMGLALLLTFDDQPYGSHDIIDATGRHTATLTPMYAQMYIDSGIAYSGTGSLYATEPNGEILHYITLPDHEDWRLGSGGTGFSVHTYFTRENLDEYGVVPIVQHNGWNLTCDAHSGGQVTLTASVGGSNLYGQFTPQADEWWRLQIDNSGGALNLRAQRADDWTSGTVLDSDPGGNWTEQSGELRLFETEAVRDTFHFDEFTIKRSDLGSEEFEAPVVRLKQVRFPTTESSYLVAQVRYPSGANNVYVSTSSIPAEEGSGTWRHIYGLSGGAGILSLAALNDRLIMTEGMISRPLVFAGGLDASGADWAAPRAAMITYDSGLNWHDITPEICDTDPDTRADIGALGGNSGRIAICCDLPKVHAFYVEMESGNTSGASLTVEGYSGNWNSGHVWTDGTSGLSQTGVIEYTPVHFSSTYHVNNGMPGYWFRLIPTATSPNTRVRRILFQAPVQPLQVIGEGQADTPLGFVYYDASELSAKDFTVQVSDNSTHTFARLNDGALENPTGMNSSDFIAVGYLTPFTSIDITLHNDYKNSEAAVLSGAYWNGSAWTPFSGFTDRTQDPSGVTLARNGAVSWAMPPDWKQNRSPNEQYPQGYWVALTVSANLTAKTYISEARVRPQPEPLKKSKFALTVRDRLILCNRSDAPDQIDISRALEEYGFTGEDSASLRIGGQDPIVAVAEAFNQGFIAKTEDWYLLNGYNAATFAVERAEAAGQTPVNDQVVVRAPHTEADNKNLMGLYYINPAGAWYFAGLKVYQISQDVSWWDPNADLPRLDPDNLHLACGVYWPERNWVIWSVPMIVEGTEQTTNNRLIVYDLTQRAWLPPFTISLASLTTAFHRCEGAPGKIGPVGLYGGDYRGRVVRLFAPGCSTDLGSPIAAWVETGRLHFKAPEFKKLLRMMTLYGRTAGSGITVKIYTDGEVESPRVYTFSDLAGLENVLFAQEQKPQNVGGRFFKFRIEFTDATDVFGLQLGISVIREWGEL